MFIRRPSELGAIIAAARRDRGLTQGDLAKRLGVSRVWLGQIERGKSSARIDMVFRVLNELDIALTTGTGSLPPGQNSPRKVAAFDIDMIADTGLTSTSGAPVARGHRVKSGR